MIMNTWVDTIHGMQAVSRSRTGAWMLIRSECKRQGLEVPTLIQIKLRPLTPITKGKK